MVSKIMRIILVFLILFSSLTFTPCVNAMDMQYLHKVEVLNALDIINTEQFFAGGEFIERGELASILVKFSGYEAFLDTDAAEIYFSDVDSSNEWSNDISLAVKLRLVSGMSDGLFRPYEPATVIQTLKVVLSVLGYSEYAEAKGGYPYGYLVVGSETSLLSSVSKNSDSPISRIEFINLIFRALSVNIMEMKDISDNGRFTVSKSENILTKNHDVKTVRGRVMGNHDTLLRGASNLNEDQLLIDDEIYFISDKLYNSFIGYYVTAYAKLSKETNRSNIIYLLPDYDSQNIMTVDAEYITDDTTITELRYTEDDERSKRIKISPKADFIYNGKAVTTVFSESLLVPELGEVTLIDTGVGNGYDLVIISSYKTYVSEPASETRLILTDKYTKPAISLRDKKYTVIKDGKKATLNDIGEWDILGIRESIDKELYEILVTAKPVKGSISETTEDGIVINDIEYELSKNFLKAVDDKNVPALSFDCEGYFYLNHKGMISAANILEIGGLRYGYLLDIGYKADTLEGKVSFKIVNNKSSIEILKASEKIVINGDATIKEDEIKTLPEFKVPSIDSHCRPVIDGLKRQIIAYETNKKGEITVLHTPDEDITPTNDFYTDPTNPRKILNLNYQRSTGTVHYWYNSWNKILENGVRLTENTEFYVVPQSPTDDVSKYKCIKMTQLQDNKGYPVEVYDVDEFNTARAVVVWDRDGFTTGLKGYYGMFAGFSQAVNLDGDPINMIKLYCDGKLNTLQLAEDNMYYSLGTAERNTKRHINESAFKGLKYGMPVKFYKDSKGEVSAVHIYIKPTYNFDGVDKLPFGQVTKTDGKLVAINTTVDGELFDSGNKRVYDISKSNVYCYSSVTGSIITGTVADISTNSVVYIDYHSSEVKNVLVYSFDDWMDMKAYLTNLEKTYPRLANDNL